MRDYKWCWLANEQWHLVARDVSAIAECQYYTGSPLYLPLQWQLPFQLLGPTATK